MWKSHVTDLAFRLIHAIDQGQEMEVSEVQELAEHGGLITALEERCDLNLSHLYDVREEMEQNLESLNNTYLPEKVGASSKGLCLVLGWAVAILHTGPMDGEFEEPGEDKPLDPHDQSEGGAPWQDDPDAWKG